MLLYSYIAELYNWLSVLSIHLLKATIILPNQYHWLNTLPAHFLKVILAPSYQLSR